MANKLGFSLIELLISLTIGAFIVAGLMNAVINNKLATDQQGLKATLNDQLALAEYFFKQALASAGYAGCHPLDYYLVNGDLTNSANPNDTPITIQGLPPDKQGNDGIRIGNADPQIYYTNSVIGSAIAVSNASSENFVKKAMIISDCKHAETFLGTKSRPKLISCEPTLRDDYDTNSQVFVWHDKTYTIEKVDSFRDENNRAYYALYQKDANKPEKEELALYIRHLNISYSTDGRTFNAYNAATDWRAIKMVQISLTASTQFQQKQLSKTNTFKVALRNRL